jgi:Fe2+ transport system protein FeoA
MQLKFRLRAFGIHLAASATVLAFALLGLYLGWYRWPGWYLTGVLHVAAIMVGVDAALGPTLTLLIANPRKPRRELARDIGVIVAVQLVALVYGTATLWQGRPLYYAFSEDRLEIVQASALLPNEIALARQQNPGLAPHWYSLPRWVWAPLPDDPETRARIMASAIAEGQDVIDMPRYFRPWQQGLPALRQQLKKVDAVPVFTRREQQALKERLTELGFPADQPIASFVTGPDTRLLVVFDPATLAIRIMIPPPESRRAR